MSQGPRELGPSCPQARPVKGSNRPAARLCPPDPGQPARSLSAPTPEADSSPREKIPAQNPQASNLRMREFQRKK